MRLRVGEISALEEARDDILKAIETTPLERFEQELEVLQSLILQKAGQPSQGKE